MSALEELLIPVVGFLAGPTPEAWLVEASRSPELLLIDHANCEKKAASTALAMVFRYEDRAELVARMSRLAREELRHFEQVTALMARRGIPWRRLSAGRYAGALRAEVRGPEPDRLVDLLVCGAFVEARSCERFAGLVGRVDSELDAFYGRLLRSEARHFEVYLALARSVASAQEVAQRVAHFRAVEHALVLEPDAEFRFHSGPPQQTSDQEPRHNPHQQKSTSSTASARARA